MPPRLQHRRVEFLVGRWRDPRHKEKRGGLVRGWQLVIWSRQIALLLIATVGSEIATQINVSEHRNQLVMVEWLQVGLALAVLLISWGLQCCYRPYALRYQNAMESWLLISAIVLVALAGVYSSLSAELVAARMANEVLLLVVLLGSLTVSALYFVFRLRATRRALASIDLAKVLLAVDERIDEPLVTAVRKGDVRLVRCSWLLENSRQRISRRQDLPEEAFFQPHEAAELLQRGDRSVLALTYGWWTPLHPE